MPPFLRGLTKEQWEDVESEGREVWESDSDGESSQGDGQGQGDDYSDMMSDSEDAEKAEGGVPMRTAKVIGDDESDDSSEGDSDTEIFAEKDGPAGEKPDQKALAAKLEFLKAQMAQVDGLLDSKKLK